MTGSALVPCDEIDNRKFADEPIEEEVEAAEEVDDLKSESASSSFGCRDCDCNVASENNCSLLRRLSRLIVLFDSLAPFASGEEVTAAILLEVEEMTPPKWMD